MTDDISDLTTIFSGWIYYSLVMHAPGL